MVFMFVVFLSNFVQTKEGSTYQNRSWCLDGCGWWSVYGFHCHRVHPSANTWARHGRVIFRTGQEPGHSGEISFFYAIKYQKLKKSRKCLDSIFCVFIGEGVFMIFLGFYYGKDQELTNPIDIKSLQLWRITVKVYKTHL